MPRYFFSLDDDAALDEEDGVECADDAVARRMALRALSDALMHNVDQSSDEQSYRIHVTDEHSRPIYSALLVLSGSMIQKLY